jgi:hypothetical protein
MAGVLGKLKSPVYRHDSCVIAAAEKMLGSQIGFSRPRNSRLNHSRKKT